MSTRFWITVNLALLSRSLRKCARLPALALLLTLALPLTIIAQQEEPVSGLFGFSASPDTKAKGPVIVVNAKRHTHYSRDEAFSVEAVSLAQGIAELQYIRKIVERAKQGATVYTWVDQPRQMVDSSNVDAVMAVIDQKLSDYREVSEKRGFAKLSSAFDVVNGGYIGRTLLEQCEGNLVWWTGEMHFGAIVEDTFVIINSLDPNIMFIGKTTNRDTINIQVWGSIFSWVHPEEFAPERLVKTIVWCARSGEEPEYATAFGMRASYWFDCLEYENALRDADAAIERDPQLRNAYAIRSQLLSCSPLEKMRDGESALAAARKYCELVQNKRDSWRCHGLMAAALAEKRDFDAAIAELESAIVNAPEQNKARLLSDLEKYSEGITPRLPEKTEN